MKLEVKVHIARDRRHGASRRFVTGLAALIMASLLAGLSVSAGADASSRNVAKGQLVGGIVLRGRVPGGASAHRYQRGLVRVIRDGRVVARERVRTDHRYHFRLRPGLYDIVAHTKWGKCEGGARVRAGHTTNANAYCVFH